MRLIQLDPLTESKLLRRYSHIIDRVTISNDLWELAPWNEQPVMSSLFGDYFTKTCPQSTQLGSVNRLVKANERISLDFNGFLRIFSYKPGNTSRSTRWPTQKGSSQADDPKPKYRHQQNARVCLQ